MLTRLLFLCLGMFLSWNVQAQFPCVAGEISLASGQEDTYCDDGSGTSFIRFRSAPAGIPRAYVVVNSEDEILYIGYSGNINFAGFGDNLRVYSFSLVGSITAEVGDNLNDAQLASGCSELSTNFINITQGGGGQLGGTLAGGPFEFCVGNFVPDFIEEGEIILSGELGDNTNWIITDADGNILGLPASPFDVNFDFSGPGSCQIYNISYIDGLQGLEMGENIADLGGCFSLSNAVVVNRIQPRAGVILGGPYNFCVGDGQPDMIPFNAITIVGGSGLNFSWLVTDIDDNIIGLPDSPYDVDFDGAGEGRCYIRYITTFDDEIPGLAIGTNLDDLGGCFNFSNRVTVNRTRPTTAILSGGPFNFCVGDGVADMIDEADITLTGAGDANTQWVVTDANGIILGLPPTFSAVDFDGAGTGACLIYYLNYEDGLTGLSVDADIADLVGCFGWSNAITVNRDQAEGGMLAGGPFSFCVNNGDPDMIGEDEITLSGNSGLNSQWIVTDADGNILGLPPTFSVVDFDDAGAGACLIYHLSYADGLAGLATDLNVADLEGCFDLSNSIIVNRTELTASTLTGGPFDFCVGNFDPDLIPEGAITLEQVDAANASWVITDANGIILGLPDSPFEVNFDFAGGGACLIYYLTYADGLTGLSVDADIADLNGCFGLSNAVTVNRTQPSSGVILGGPFNFCTGDGNPDMIPEGAINIVGGNGVNFAWLVTDADDNIIGLPPSPYVVDFEGAGGGRCYVRYITFDDDIQGFEIGTNLMDLGGCFNFSNRVTVNRNLVGGGTLEGGPFTFCAGDGEADMIGEDEITLTGETGDNAQWVVTDANNNILGLPPTFAAVDFDGAGAGACIVYHLSYNDGLTGLEAANNLSELEGCFSLSNGITINRNQPEAGTLEGGVYNFCANDGVADMIDENSITLSGESGANMGWIITDANGMILGLPPSFTAVDFDGAGAGACLIYHISYADGLEGLAADLNVADLSGCFDLSNSITVNRFEGADCDDNLCNLNGGFLTGGPFTYCAGDGEADMIDENDITLVGNMGTNTQWVVTDANGNILGLPPTFSVVDFDGAGAGACLVYHLSYEDGLEGLAAELNVAELTGCFDLSNAVIVNRNQPEGGTLVGGPFSFCVSDGIADRIPAGSISLDGNSGANSSWIVTDSDGNILGLPPMPGVVDFDGAGEGACLIYNIGYADGLQGLEMGLNLDDLTGCFGLSNAVVVDRTAVNGGIVSTLGGETTVDVTVNDGVDDVIEFISEGAIGENFTYVITDADNVVLGIPMGNSANFETSGVGACRVWGLSYTGELLLEAGDIVGDVAISEGCSAISEIFITVNRTEGFQVSTPQTTTIVTPQLDVQLYPNPVVDQLQIGLTNSQTNSNELLELMVVQMDGKIMYRTMVDPAQSRTTVDVSNLPAGTYFIRINDGAQLISKRFVVVK